MKKYSFNFSIIIRTTYTIHAFNTCCGLLYANNLNELFLLLFFYFLTHTQTNLENIFDYVVIQSSFFHRWTYRLKNILHYFLTTSLPTNNNMIVTITIIMQVTSVHRIDINISEKPLSNIHLLSTKLLRYNCCYYGNWSSY